MPVYATSVRVSLNALRSTIVMLLAIMCIPFWSARADNTKPASAANVSMSLLTPMPTNGFKPGDQFQVQIQVSNIDNSEWSFRLDLEDYPHLNGDSEGLNLIQFGRNAILLEAEFTHGLFMRSSSYGPQKVADENELENLVMTAEESDTYSWIIDSRFRNSVMTPTDVATLTLTIEYLAYHYEIENGNKLANASFEHQLYSRYFSDSSTPTSGSVSQNLLIDFTDMEVPTGMRTYTSKFAPAGLQAGEFMMAEVGIINYGTDDDYSGYEASFDLELNLGIMPIQFGFYSYPFTSRMSGGFSSIIPPLSETNGYMHQYFSPVQQPGKIQVPGSDVAMLFNLTDRVFKVRSVGYYCNYDNSYDSPDCDIESIYLNGGDTKRIFIQGAATLEEAGGAFEISGSILSSQVPFECKSAPESVNCKEVAADAIESTATTHDVDISFDIAPIVFEKTVNEECFETGDTGNFNVRLSGADFRKVVGLWYVSDLVPSGVKPESITPNFLLSEMLFNPDLGIVSKELNGGFVYIYNGLFAGIGNIGKIANKVTSVSMPSKLSDVYQGPDFSYLDEFEFDLGFSIDESTEPGEYVNTANFGFISLFSLISQPTKQADETEPVYLMENGFIVVTEEVEEEFLDILLEELVFFVELGTNIEASAGYTVGCVNLVVSGYKFEDHNANGVRDQGDQGLYGWTITVQGSAGTFTTTTDENGFYMIEGLKPGSYQVREEQREGWYQSAPMGEGFYNVALTKERPTTTANFGNFRKSRVYGYKYVDLNGSGERDDNEPAMEDVRVFLKDLSGNLVAEALTDSDGYFEMLDLKPGHYALYEDIPEGMYQSQPGPAQGGFYNFELRSGYQAGPNMFGNYYLTSVTGDVYYTTDISFKDADGKALNTRLAAPGVTVSGVRTGPAPLKPASGDPVVLPGSTTFEVQTDDEGHFHVDGLLPGLYTVSVSPPEFVTVVTGNPLTEVLVSGGYVEVEFGLYYDELAAPEPTKSSISGSMFRDLDGDGRWHFPSELGVQGRTVTLHGMSKRGAEITRTATTDANGTYTFSDLPAGTYTVFAPSASGVSVSAPFGGSYLVELGADEHWGSGPSGAPGGAGWLQGTEGGSDAGVARMTLAIDLDLDGVADTRVDVTGRALFNLGGLPGQTSRPLELVNVQMYAADTDGHLITVTTPGIVAGQGSITGPGSQADTDMSAGLVLSQSSGIYWMSEGALAFEGTADRWPMRHTRASFSGSVNLRDVQGTVVARIVYAELTPLFGADFAAERADFGDAPASYGTLRAVPGDPFVITPGGIVYPNDGARHLLPWTGSSALTLGAGVTADADGQPGANADGDTDNGVVLPAAVAPNAPFTATVTVAGEGLLSVWVDANRNGVFESSERQVSDEPVETGEYEVTLHSGAATSSGTTIVRVRLTTQVGVGATGLALDGEVEDYLLTVDASMAGGGGGLPTSDDGDAALPTSFALHQNFPNPFNPSTVIPYDLASQSRVRITVYDVTGRPVATVLDASQNAGRHQVTFDAAGLPSGVYMVRLEAGGQVMVRKLTLLK